MISVERYLLQHKVLQQMVKEDDIWICWMLNQVMKYIHIFCNVSSNMCLEQNVN